MPYIPQSIRRYLDPFVDALDVSRIMTWGSLNYLLTRIILKFMLKQGLNYDNCQAVKGLLQSISDEFEARVMRPYEKSKSDDNGDIPEFIDISGVLKKQQSCLEKQK
jgi:hypothetical protein